MANQDRKTKLFSMLLSWLRKWSRFGILQK